MANRILDYLRQFSNKDKKEEIVIIKELTEANKLLANLGPKSRQERVKNIGRARQLVLDAKKHDQRLAKLSEQLEKGISTLPPNMKAALKGYEDRMLMMERSIIPYLNRIAQELAIKADAQNRSMVAAIDENSKPMYQINRDITNLIREIKYLFQLQARVTAFLEAAEQQSR